MRHTFLSIVMISALLSPAPVVAAEVDAGFALVPATGEQLKIDRTNGRVSICAADGGNWRCHLIPDDRDAYEADISRLESENDALRAEIAALKKASSTDQDRFGTEDLEKMEKFMAFSDHAFRQFFDVVDGLKRDGKIPNCP